MSLKLPTRKMVSQQDSAMIQRPDIPRSRFQTTWSRKTTFDQGLLVPFLVDELVPGEHVRYNITALVRMATPVLPFMDNFSVETFIFAVPNRITWTNWVRLMGEQDNPSDSIAYTVPQLVSPAGGFAVCSLYDYLGLPTVGQVTGGQTVSVSALFMRAYAQICHQWFRDENLEAAPTLVYGDGPDNVAWYGLFQRAKAHDYFTSCLPYAQKFSPLAVPLAGNAPVRGIGASGGTNLGPTAFNDVNGAGVVNYPLYYDSATSNMAFNAGAVYADLSLATGVSINQLRQSFLIQQLLERDARGGTRYTEIMRSHFGVVSPDMRLQRPEYIGGGRSMVDVTPVAQTVPDASGTVGKLGAAATSSGVHSASYAATEHVIIMGLINVRSELAYQQGLHKMFTRLSRYDFYFPSLAGLGEQAVLRQEIYCTGVDADDNTVFGYQERWHEMRTRVSEVTGLFRSTSAGTIDQWHSAQRFLVPPVLGATFIKDTAPMSRILAATSTNQQFLADIMIRRDKVSPLPMYGTPVTLGRF